jgi:hypothetical protein
LVFVAGCAFKGLSGLLSKLAAAFATWGSNPATVPVVGAGLFTTGPMTEEGVTGVVAELEGSVGPGLLLKLVES